MKLTRTIAIVLMIVFALGMGLVNAQDVEVNGAAIQTAPNGTLVALEDGSYTLTLNGVEAQIPMMVYAPGFESALYDTLDFHLDWAHGADIQGTAELRFGKTVIEVTLSNPSFDTESGTFTYAATVIGSNIEAGKSGLVIPTDFEDSTLFILLNNVFLTDLSMARLDRLNTTRTVGAIPCIINCQGNNNDGE